MIHSKNEPASRNEHRPTWGKRFAGYFLSLISNFSFLFVLATVFVVRPELGNGVASGKYFWFYFSMGLIAVILVIDHWGRKQAVRIKPIDVLILLYGTSALSVSYFFHSSEAVTKHILLILVILLYFYFRMFLSVPKSRGYWPVLFFLVTGLAEVFWGLRQLYGFEHSQHHLFRLTGSFFNPGPYACYLSVVMSAAFGYLLRDRGCTKVRFKLHYWPVYLRWGTALLTCVGIVLALPAAMSRTSWLAAGGGCGFVAFFYWKHKGARRFGKIAGYSRWILTVMLALCVLGGIGMYRLKKDSADGRALTWKIALQTAIHHPLGVGIGYFSGSYGHEQADYFVSGKGSEQEQHVAGNPEYGFNDYLQIAVEQGVIPLTLFLGIMIYNVYAGIRRRRIAATASLVALLIAATASYPFSVLPFLTVTAFLSARIHSETSDRKERSESDSKFSRFQTCKFPYSLILPGIFLLIVAGCLYNRYPTYPAYRQWGRSKALYHAGAYGSGAEAYAPLYPLLADQLDFLFEYAQCLSKSGRYAESNAVLEKAVKIRCDPMLYNVMGRNCQSLRRYAEAEACFLKAAHIVPVRIYPWYLLANLYVETGDPLSTDDESLIGEITKIVHHENYIYVTDRFALYRFTEDGLFSGKIDKRGGGPDEYVAISDFEIESTDKVWILCRSSQTLNQYSWSGALNKKIKFNFWAAKMHLISSGKMCLYIGNERDENNQHQVKVIDLNTENVLNNFLEIDGKKAKYLHVNSLFHFCKKEDGLCYFYNIFDDYIIPCLKNG